MKHCVSCLTYYFMSCCSQAPQQWYGGTRPPIPKLLVFFFCFKSDQLTQNQEKHSTVDEKIRGWPKERKKCHSETPVTANGQHLYSVQWWTDDLWSHPSGFSVGDWLSGISGQRVPPFKNWVTEHNQNLPGIITSKSLLSVPKAFLATQLNFPLSSG